MNNGSDRTIDLVEVVDGAGLASTQIKNRYSHGGLMDEPLSLEVFTIDGAFDQAYTYHADHLGSIRFITDSVGEIVNTYDYDTYGRPGFTLETIDQPFRYTGREFDQATELYHYRARQYDPETGRFLQEDPIGFLAGDLNIQRYVGNNPVNLVDPDGQVSAGAAALNTHSAVVGGAAQGVGTALNCIFTGIGDAISLAGSGDVVGVNLQGCAAQGARDAVISAAFGLVPLPQLGPAWRALQARIASAQAFQLAKQAGKTKGVVAALVTKDGRVFVGFSNKARVGPTNELVKNSGLEKFCTNSRRCAEVDAINNALRAGADTNGAQLSVRAVSDTSARNARAGQPISPCNSTCGGPNGALERFGVSIAD